MQGPDRSLFRSSVGLIVAGALVIAAVIGVAAWLTERSNTLTDQIVAERGIRRSAIDLLTDVLDLETGFRGYVIAGGADFLTHYEEAQRDLAPGVADLTAQLETHHGDASEIDGLAAAIEEKVAFSDAGIALVRTRDPAAARAAVATGEGREAMDRIRTILSEVIEAADAAIVPAIERQRQTNRQLLLTILIAAAALAGLVALAIRIVRDRVHDIESARREIETLNTSLEERVEQRTHDLIQANQEIQRFAYIVTHDLRAPLVNIMGFTSELDAAAGPLRAYVLADGGTVSEQDIIDARRAAAEDLPEAIEFIKASARKMDGLINAILKISRDGRRELRPEPIDVEALAEAAAGAVGHQIAEAGGAVTIDAGVGRIVSDRLSLDQILGNLVDNAVKYARPDRPLALAIRARRTGRNYVEIEVEDNGRGIAPEDHERIFELFRRSGEQDKAGEGIGLAHVRSIARNLGGEITVRSTRGEGSTFVLRLPIDLRSFLQSVRGR
jgi:signal transduction histidine kinase